MKNIDRKVDRNDNFVMDKFDIAFKLILNAEGGYVDHPNDRGGATKYGITIKTLENHRGRPVTKDDVKNLTINESKEIYKKGYWDSLNLDGIDDHKLCTVIFDQSVNFGPGVAAKRIQSCAGVTADGVIGKMSLNKINSLDARILGLNFIKQSQMAYSKIVENNPSQSVFFRGWISRTHKLMDLYA